MAGHGERVDLMRTTMVVSEENPKEFVSCKTLESLGFVHDIGMRAKIVLHNGQQRTVVSSQLGIWRFWTVSDRTQPLVDHIEREKTAGRKWP